MDAVRNRRSVIAGELPVGGQPGIMGFRKRYSSFSVSSTAVFTSFMRLTFQSSQPQHEHDENQVAAATKQRKGGGTVRVRTTAPPAAEHQSNDYQ